MHITLYDDQQKHIELIRDIWKYNTTTVDTSVMGSGKTFCACKLGEEFEVLFVICPATIEYIWENMKNNYNLNIIIISYDILSGFKGNTLNHKYLNREDTDTKTTYTCTKEFKELIKRKCLFIVDEFQYAKNKNSRYNALKSMINYIDNNQETESKALILSGTPYDKKEHVINVLQMINLIKHDELFTYEKSSNRTQFIGIKNLFDFCNEIDSNKTQLILKETPITHKTIIDVCYKLYINIIQYKLVCAMPSPKINCEIKCYNCYFEMDDANALELKRGINMLHNLSRKKKVDDDEESRAITTAQIITQNAKVCIFVRIAEKLLNQNDTNKIVIFFDFDEPINNTANLLAQYNPVIINGKINKKERPQLISKFQENNSDCRLLIFNMSVGCAGISLDDTDGKYKRFALGAPNYHISRMHQMSRRFYRANTKSSPYILFIYGNCGTEETSIINSLAKKNEVMKDTLLLQVDEGVIFPGDYPKLMENNNISESEKNTDFLNLGLNLVKFNDDDLLENQEDKPKKYNLCNIVKIKQSKGIKYTPCTKNPYFDLDGDMENVRI